MNETKTLHVTLAEVPTDVLVHLVDHGPMIPVAITEAIAPSEAFDAHVSVASALFLLAELGYVEIAAGQHGRAPFLSAATAGGVAAVREALDLSSAAGTSGPVGRATK